VNKGFELKDVSFQCLKQINAVIPTGLTLLLGANGAGKSTLLRLLSGWNISIKGVVQPEGGAWERLTAAQLARQRVYLPQEAAHYLPMLTVEEMVGLSGQVQSSAEEVLQACISKSLEWMGLESYRTALYRNLSGGERQRVQLARCRVQATLFPEAKWSLLDEPLQSLDPFYQHQVLTFWREWAQSRCVVMSVHQINMVAPYADTVVLMHQGTICAIGHPLDVLTPEILQAVYGIEFEWIQSQSIHSLMYLVDKAR
jgi:iron complex transport system ATP-binding protein